VVALERGAEQVGDRPGAEGGQASVSRAGRVRARERWRVAAERRALRAAPRQALRAAPRPTREPPSHTRAHAAERHAVASPGRLQHVSSTRAWRDSSSLRELCLHALLASLCRARRAMCIGAVKPPPRSRGPVLFISNGGEPNSSGASSQVCLHEMGTPGMRASHETGMRWGMEVSVQGRGGGAVVTTVSFLLRWSRARSKKRRGELPSRMPLQARTRPAAGVVRLGEASLPVIDNR